MKQKHHLLLFQCPSTVMHYIGENKHLLYPTPLQLDLPSFPWLRLLLIFKIWWKDVVCAKESTQKLTEIDKGTDPGIFQHLNLHQFARK